MDDITKTQLSLELADISSKMADLKVTAINEERELSASEQRKYNKLEAESEALEGQLNRDAAMQAELRKVPRYTDSDPGQGNPLAVTPDYLSGVQHAMDNRITGLFNAETRAALTTTTYGAPREWGANMLGAPRTLYEAAGIPVSRAGSIFAQFPKLTLPATDPGVAEGATVVEFAASTAGTVTLKRYGRFTDLTRESLVGADAGAIVAAHRTAIARDLDAVLVGLINTDAGSAVGFTSDVPAAIRKAIATVEDTTAGTTGQIVVVAHPDNVALLQAVTSTGGKTIGEEFTRFSGSLVYASSACPTGFMLVGNLATACRFWSAADVATETHLDVKTSVMSVATDMIGGFGTGAIAGYVSKVDVVTP